LTRYLACHSSWKNSLQQSKRRQSDAKFKSLEQGTFEMIKQDGQVSVKIDAAELAMLLGGVSIENAKRRKRLKVA
jgi:hypothetical protein